MLSLCLLSRFRPVLVHKFQHLPCYQLTQCVHPLSTKMKEQFLPITKQLPTAPKDCLLGLNPSPMWCVYRGYAKKLKTKSKKDKGKTKISLNLEAVEEVISITAMKNEMVNILEQLKTEYINQLSLRISTSMFQTIPVETADGKFPLNQLGQVIQKNPSLIIINLSMSPQYLTAVKEAIINSGIGINPQIDSTSIFLPIPKVTKEQREKLYKSAKTLCDKSKQQMRDVNNKYTKKLRAIKQDHSEDLIHSIQELLLSIMHENVALAEMMMTRKQQDLMGVK